MVLFTDGLYDVYSPQGNEFGRSGLISSFLRYANLPAEKFCAAILKDVSGFAERSDFDDDVCIVMVERASKNVKRPRKNIAIETDRIELRNRAVRLLNGQHQRSGIS